MATKRELEELKPILEHPILQKAYALRKNTVTIEDALAAPHNPQEFLDWWWSLYGVSCNDCILATHRNSVTKPDGYLDGYPKIMVLGEGAGALEDAAGMPFVGPNELRASQCGTCYRGSVCFSHKMLKNPKDRHPKNKVITCDPKQTNKIQLTKKFYLQSAGAILDGILINKWKMSYPRQNWIDLYNRENEDQWAHPSPWFFTNIILCRSYDPTTNKDQPPPTVAKSTCKRWLTWQYAAVQPKITICFGREAIEALVGKPKVKDLVRGQIYQDPKWGPIIYQAHPAHFMREDNAHLKALMFAKVGQSFELALQYAGYLK